MAERFFCPDLPVSGRLTLSGDEARHLARVRRLGPGDQVELFDGRSSFALRAEVTRIGSKDVELALLGDRAEGWEPPFPLTLATAIPKGERLDWLVEKAVEIGVSHLVPLQTRRSVVDPRPSKLDRLRRAVIEASKQCGRNRLMTLSEPTRFPPDLAEDPPALRLISHPSGRDLPHWPSLQPHPSATLAIGPEGGWTDDELALAQSRGWIIIGFPTPILRMETAALVGSALLLTHYSSRTSS